MFTIFIKPAGDRPDFRVVLAFLWGDDHNCDTDGDSDNPASREWTCLYASSRERPGEVVDIFPQQKQPLVLGVESPIESLAAGAAYIFGAETNGTVSESPNGPYVTPSSLIPRGNFDLESALDRVRKSPFRRSTLQKPYPNLDASNTA